MQTTTTTNTELEPQLSTGNLESMGFEPEVYWYHPNYLEDGASQGLVDLVCEHPGRRPVDLVSNIDGDVHQFFLYTAWGENLHEYTSSTSTFNSPYRFNGKELDEETGLAYYGARYYQNKYNIWLGVDPLAGKYPYSTPYVFSGANPVLYIDPNGMEIVNPYDQETDAEKYDAFNNAIETFKEANPEAYSFLHSKEEKIVLNFSSELGDRLNGRTDIKHDSYGSASLNLSAKDSEGESLGFGIFSVKKDPKNPLDGKQTGNQSDVLEILKPKVTNIMVNINSELLDNPDQLAFTLSDELGHVYSALKNTGEDFLWSRFFGNSSHPKGKGHDKRNPSGRYADLFEERTRKYCSP